MSSGKVVTLRDVAEKAGVSVMTVSRVLRNQRNISTETKEKVNRIAAELGYRPNPMVSALMSYRRSARQTVTYSSLGFLTSFPSKQAWRENRLYQEFFEGAKVCADRHGFGLEEFWLREPGMSAERMSQILYNRNVPGLLIAPLPVSQGHLRLDWEKFSAVTIGYSLARPLLHRAVNHQFRSMRLAMRQLRKVGYKRMGLAMSGSYDNRVDHQWSGSFLAEQVRFEPGDKVPLYLVEDEEWTETNFVKWYRKNQPDVIISQQKEIVKWLSNLNLKVPQDVGFVHMNCPDNSGEFAGIYQNGRVIGEVAVDFLVAMVQRNERGVPSLAHSVLVEGTWVDGKTIRKTLR